MNNFSLMAKLSVLENKHNQFSILRVSRRVDISRFNTSQSCDQSPILNGTHSPNFNSSKGLLGGI